MKTKQLQYATIAAALVLLALVIYLLTRKKEELYNLLPSAISQPMINSTIKQRINQLHPQMQPFAKELISRAKNELGMELTIPKDGAYRSIAEQDALYAKGRTEPGSIVTKVKGGNSWHNYGLAFDVVEVKPQYGYAKGYPKERWLKLGVLGKSLGIKWGGDFTSLVDYPHFELPITQTRSQLLAIVNQTNNPYPPVNLIA